MDRLDGAEDVLVVVFGDAVVDWAAGDDSADGFVAAAEDVDAQLAHDDGGGGGAILVLVVGS